MTDTIIDIIRHGEPVGGSRYRGQIDDPLSDKGWQQMREAVAGYTAWESVVSSSLSRCAAFAYELGENMNLDVSLDDRLKEIGFGCWEGKTKAELRAEDPQQLERFWQDPVAHRPEGAETLVDFRSRVIAGWNHAVDQHQGRHILMVGHAGMMRMIIREVLGMPLDMMFKIDVPNAGISRVRVSHYEGGSNASLVFHAGVPTAP